MNLTRTVDSTFRLVGGRCKRCGDYSFPRKPTCRSCNCDEVEETLLSSRGTVYAYTIIRVRPPAGFSLPYTLGYVQLDHEHIVIPALFAATEEQLVSLAIGDPVELAENHEQNSADYLFTLLPKNKRATSSR